MRAWRLKCSPGGSNPALEAQIQLWRLKCSSNPALEVAPLLSNPSRFRGLYCTRLPPCDGQLWYPDVLAPAGVQARAKSAGPFGAVRFGHQVWQWVERLSRHSP